MTDDVVETARELLGEEEARLRPGQREAMEAALERDTLAVLATATGKTLVYLVAARLLGGGTVVVSPTIALQADQVAELTTSGTRAARLDSRLGPRRRAELVARLGHDLDVLLMTPEQLGRDDVVDDLRRVDVRLLVVDEAHCVSAWGEDFRPDYLALGNAVAALGHPRVLALTATAPPAVREEVVATLGMRDPAVVVGQADRPELHLEVVEVSDEDAVTEGLVDLLRPLAEAGSTSIVYAATRRRTEELRDLLRDADLPAVAYHGGLPARERERVHEDFRSGEADLVVATSAFGLGVDRPDVRLVAHADPPETLDAYWQEAGRAGRDGEQSRAVLFSRPGGYGVRRYFAAGSGASAADLHATLAAVDERRWTRLSGLREATGLSQRRVRRAVNVLVRTGAVREGRSGVRLAPRVERGAAVTRALQHVEDQRTRHETGVDLVRRYAETTDCRRRLVLELLGEDHPDPCGRCDRCEAGTAQVAAERPFALGAEVVHDELGRGSVSQYEGDRLVVLFEHEGYRTLSLDLVLERDLLRPAGNA